MNQKDSIFGAEPDRLRQLIRSGMAWTSTMQTLGITLRQAGTSVD